KEWDGLKAAPTQAAQLLPVSGQAIPGFDGNLPFAAGALQDEQDFSCALEGLLWRRKRYLLAVDAPFVRHIAVNLDVPPIHRAVDHLGAGHLLFQIAEPS